MIAPPIGLAHSASLRVAACHTVPQVADWPGFADMPPVFATAMMIGFIEQTCIMALRPYLAAGQHSVGVGVDISHTAATPIGMDITAEVVLTGIEGKVLTFTVSARDDAGPIGAGTHKRALIDVARFMDKLASKSRAL